MLSKEKAERNREKVDILYTMLELIDRLHALWEKEEDEVVRDELISSMSSLIDSEQTLKKSYVKQVIEPLKKL